MVYEIIVKLTLDGTILAVRSERKAMSPDDAIIGDKFSYCIRDTNGDRCVDKIASNQWMIENELNRIVTHINKRA